MKLRFLVPFLFALLLTACAGCAGSSAPVAPEGVTAQIDLTALEVKDAYVEVCRMQVYTDRFVGKTVMARGAFRAVEDPAGDGYLFQCLVPDGNGCCNRELEFVLAGEHAYPADYPKTGAEIIVVGTLSTYTRNGSTYCTLTDAAMYT